MTVTICDRCGGREERREDVIGNGEQHYVNAHRVAIDLCTPCYRLFVEWFPEGSLPRATLGLYLPESNVLPTVKVPPE